MYKKCTVWHNYSLIRWQSFYGRKAKSLEKLLSSAGNAVLLVFLKYQEIDV